MSRRTTIHELAEVLAILCTNETIADLIESTLSADAEDRLDDYQVQLAEALFDSLCEIRTDCVTLAQERGTVKPRRTFFRFFL